MNKSSMKRYDQWCYSSHGHRMLPNAEDGEWVKFIEADAVITSLEQQLADAQKRIAVAVKIYELSPLHANGTFVVHPAHNMLYFLTMPMDELNQFLIEHPEYKENSNE